ncbi:MULTISPECIES: hypothetical protein [unclassified Streptomyces]|uniref:hypothetical protein n=1 Tax=unclassified Streptomyces TaxID=2593676 RepID=UPI001BE6646C|nr:MULTISPECIES: hypothetical protein [unclassified Streptomyces]MBT2406881.1 hypothetical protein [Streptomyces sp. ISL-21]MBT2613084.1 hypothetical protein [Streptomyces sp. ISL-87]
MTMVDAGQQWMHSLLLYLRWGGSVVACIVFTYKAPHFIATLTDILRPRPSRPAPDSRPSAGRWQGIQRDHDRIKDEYGQLCIDPCRSAELAILDDLTVPEAVALIQALAEANDAAETTDYRTYEQAVLHLAKAWRHAQALTESVEPCTVVSRALAPATPSTSPGAELA